MTKEKLEWFPSKQQMGVDDYWAGVVIISAILVCLMGLWILNFDLVRTAGYITLIALAYFLVVYVLPYLFGTIGRIARKLKEGEIK